uniref:Putative ovule protein n=1 Tax=Solanum chacoense TaxID=4108 RepID=A0A0V0GGW8_SOLCH
MADLVMAWDMARVMDPVQMVAAVVEGAAVAVVVVKMVVVVLVSDMGRVMVVVAIDPTICLNIIFVILLNIII